ncbi:MAG: DUF4390 domain-containing protein [Deltaproteobacteria bacterium]|nr:DUF4390 domain-containing protein [Deltaproteobacteria bacterium]
MGFRRVSLLLLCLLAALAAAPPCPWARTGLAYIDAVTLRRGPRADLSLSFRVQKAFDSRVLDTLDSGLPVRFTYWVQIARGRDVLPDQVVSDIRVERTLVKDNLKDRYKVTLAASGEEKDFATLAEAIEVMSRVDGLHLLPLDALARQAPLTLKIKAQLQKFQLPFHLHIVLAFLSYWDVDTDWYVLELPRSVDALP